MYELAHNPEVQERLYAEVAEVLGSTATYETFEQDALEKMTYLQAVVKETLRMHSVVAHGLFKAGQDNVIPLSEPVIKSNGEKINSLPVDKGQRVVSI